MNRAAVLGAFALVWSCAIRDARTSGQPCSTNDECDSSVCYLGECRSPSSSLALVHAEVRSGDAKYGTLQRPAIDLRKTPVVDFTLQPFFTVSGRVMQRSDPSGTSATPVPGAVVVFTDLAPAIPDRVVSISAQSDTATATAGAYTVRLPAATYDVLVSAATSPVSRPDGPVIRSESALDLVLPAKASLAHVTGTLQVNGTGRLGGAQVSAIDAAGTAIVVAQVSAANGTFALDLPPGPPAFSLQVGPQAAASANDPVPSFNPKSFPAGQGSDLGTIDLGILPAPATLTGKVVDARGAGVASARVVLLSTGAAGYVLSAQTTTLTDGSFSARVRAGSYLLEVAPDVAPSQPAVSDPVTVQVTAPTTAFAVVCPDKIKVDGVVLRSDGRPVSAGFRVDATRLPDQLVSGRGTQTTSTDARGAFSLVLDRGRYRAEITPTTDSALPRTISTIDVPATATPVALPPLHISPPLEVLGTVGASAGNNPRVGIPGATIDFYAFDSTGRKSVLIGSAVSDSSGQYKAVLPDVAQFAAQ